MKAEQQLIELATSADASGIAELSRDVIKQGLGWSWTAPRVWPSYKQVTPYARSATRKPL